MLKNYYKILVVENVNDTFLGVQGSKEGSVRFIKTFQTVMIKDQFH